MVEQNNVRPDLHIEDTLNIAQFQAVQALEKYMLEQVKKVENMKSN